MRSLWVSFLLLAGSPPPGAGATWLPAGGAPLVGAAVLYSSVRLFAADGPHALLPGFLVLEVEAEIVPRNGPSHPSGRYQDPGSHRHPIQGVGQQTPRCSDVNRLSASDVDVRCL